MLNGRMQVLEGNEEICNTSFIHPQVHRTELSGTVVLMISICLKVCHKNNCSMCTNVLAKDKLEKVCEEL